MARGNRETYRVEIRFARQGWFLLRPDATGLTARKANAVAVEQRDFESHYAALGARPNPVRVVRERDGQSMWLA